MSGCDECISSGEEYRAHFQNVLAGDTPNPCVDTNLMVSIQYQNQAYDPSPTLKYVPKGVPFSLKKKKDAKTNSKLARLSETK
jgi:hypothetical protein